MNNSEFASKILEVMDLSDLEQDPILSSYVKKFDLMIGEFESNYIQVADIKENLIKNIGTDSYVSHACEFSLLYYFFKKFPEGFKFHVDSNVSKTGNVNDKARNYDIHFLNDGYSFHVEVKTFKFSDNEGKLPVKIFLPKDQMESLYEQGLRPARNLMPKISKALKDANGQLPEYQDKNVKNINIAIICVNDLDEYADALTCLIHSEIGILSPKNKGNKIVATKEELDKIDAIILCNLGYEHNVIFDRNKLINFYRTENVEIDGSEIWDYYRSVPVLPMHFWVSDEAKLDEEKCYKIQHILFSHTGYYIKYYKNDANIQEALFELFNDILNGRVKS